MSLHGNPPAPFIVGAIRSGTTLLRLMLDAHPDLAIPPETSFPPEFLRASASMETEGTALAATLAGMKKFSDFGMTAETVAALLPAGRFPVVDGLRRFYSAYAARFSKTRWGDKSPSYLFNMREIAWLLPEARFIHVIRDGRDTLASQREARTGLFRNEARDAAEHATYWQKCILTGHAVAPALAHYMEVRYERLIREPADALREICAFIDMDYHPAMLRYHERAAQRLAELGARRRADGSIQTEEERRGIFKLTQRPPDVTRIGRWRETLSEADVYRFEEVAGITLQHLGYPLSTRDPAESEAIQAARQRLLASPADAAAHALMGLALEKSGRHDRALACLLSAHRMAPDDAALQAQYAQALERMERFGDAWDCLAGIARAKAPAGVTAWAGQPIGGKRIALRRRIRHVGAEVRQARFIHPLCVEAASCTVIVEPRLVGLFARSFPAAKVIPPDVPASPIDFDLCYEDAAALYGRSADELQSRFVPLVADPDRVKAFRQTYRAAAAVPLVGISWASTNHAKHVPSVGDWKPLLSGGKGRFVSLQYGDCHQDFAKLGAMADRPVIRDESVDQLNDMDAFAAQMSSLDVVVTISCTAAHLAGALGVPTILLLDPEGDLVWPYLGNSTPWYPTVRILRRRADQPWADLMTVAADLASRATDLPSRRAAVYTA